MFEVLKADNNCSPAIIWVKGERLSAGVWIVLVVQQAFVEEEVHMMLCVVDETEGRDAAWFKSQVLHHPLWRSKGELAARRLSLCLECLFQSGFEVVDVEVVVTMEADEIVLVALVVAHKNVLAVDRAIVLPPALCLLNRLALGVVVASEGDVMFPEIAEYFVLSFRSHS